MIDDEEPDEEDTGPQQFAKVGTRNAMVIAVCWSRSRSGPSGAGWRRASARGPDAARGDRGAGVHRRRARLGRRAPVPDDVLARFGELVGACARPIDDVRDARYRRHAVAVLGRRTLRWAWSAYA